MKFLETDCLIIGTGLAGCSAAMELAEQGRNVILLSRSKDPFQTATAWAQGGIVYRGVNEEPGQLSQDITVAGAGLCHPKAVEVLSEEGPALVKQILIDRLAVPFEENEPGNFSLTEEGAHSVPRILHHGDETGRLIQGACLSWLRERKEIQILFGHTAVDLLTPSHHSERPIDLYEPSRCVGAYVYDQAQNEVSAILAKETILATGGLGQLYHHTTNPNGARGDGLAMAYRTGARVMNLEYVQFHPTALYDKRASQQILISESLRGEGAKLKNQSGEEFMFRYDERGALAPRDVVARAIHDEMLREGSHFVCLDISHKDSDWIQNRFPFAYAQCRDRNLDITRKPIPVVPAAHYACGGVAADLDGATTIANLWAVGEVACTGVHGANRLASTSLLESLVWGVRAAKKVGQALAGQNYQFPSIRPWCGEAEPIDHDLLMQDWITIKHTMWNYVGLIRTQKRLERAQRILRELADEVDKFYCHTQMSDHLIGLRNGIAAAQLILTAARRNRTSTGCHYLRDT